MEALVPSLVVFGSAAVLFVIAGLTIRGVRRTPRAKAKREVVWTRAGSALVHLDNAIEESDIELGLAGAMYAGTAPRTLAIARAKAAETRDAAFAQYQLALDRKDRYPAAAGEARRAGETANRALITLESAQVSHKKWLTENADAKAQVAEARERLTSLELSIGDTSALERDLAGRFDDKEIAPVRDAMKIVQQSIDEANAALAKAEDAATQPGSSVIADLADGEKALRAAEHSAAAAEQAHKAVIDASIAVRSEIASVRADVAKGVKLQGQIPADAGLRVGEELSKALTAIEALEQRAATEPRATVTEISRIRDRIDVALGSARSARDRIEGARSALPATIATARNAIAHAATIVSQGSGADARVRLTAAQDALAASRAADDAVAALDAVRRAIRHAEDAEALALYSRSNRS